MRRSRASGGSSPTCQKLGKTDAATENAIVDFYTPSHWKALLSGGSLVAGLAGDTVTTSTKSVNGFTLTCINLKTPGGTGTGIICTTSQGLLGSRPGGVGLDQLQHHQLLVVALAVAVPVAARRHVTITTT